MRTIKSQLVLMAIAIGIFGLCQCSSNNTQQFLEASVTEINKKLPQTLDAATTFELCEALPNGTLKANYTLFPHRDVQVDSSAFRLKMTPGLIYNTAINLELKPLRDRNVNFLYSYKDKKGNTVCEILVTPANYNQKEVLPQPFDIEDLIVNDSIKLRVVE